MRSAGACFCQISLSAFSLAIAPESESHTWRSRGEACRSRSRPSASCSRPGQQVALEDRRGCGGEGRRLEQIGVAVAEGVDADAADPVEHPAAVRQAHVGAHRRGHRAGSAARADGRAGARARAAHARRRRRRASRCARSSTAAPTSAAAASRERERLSARGVRGVRPMPRAYRPAGAAPWARGPSQFPHTRSLSSFASTGGVYSRHAGADDSEDDGRGCRTPAA